MPISLTEEILWDGRSFQNEIDQTAMEIGV
jgi:hypothetical protein